MKQSKFSTILVIFVSLILGPVMANVTKAGPISTEAFQLQRLIDQSKSQLEQLKTLLAESRKNSHQLKEANQILSQLISGIDQSLSQHKDSSEYHEALIQIQKKGDYKNTVGEALEMRRLTANSESPQWIQNFEKFQKNSVKSNEADLQEIKSLEERLESASFGLTQKINAHANLRSWKNQARISTQLTELLSNTRIIREELKILREREENASFIKKLLEGSQMTARPDPNGKEIP